jgi:hypothetical protein
MGWQAVGLAATIIVRSYNNFGVPAADLAAARDHARVIVEKAGMNIVWVDCWVGTGPKTDEPARCQQPVGGDIVLRLQKTNSTDTSRFVSMGFSLVGTPGAASFLATVYVDRTESVAHNARVDARRVLGLAIAHEIGHVLLDNNSHAGSGLMRADWSQHQLRRKDTQAWQFLETEATDMRAAAIERQSGAGGITASLALERAAQPVAKGTE